MRSLIMRGTVLMLVCGMVLSSGLPDLEGDIDLNLSHRSVRDEDMPKEPGVSSVRTPSSPVEAEQRMGESLGCRGGSTQHRSLLQSHTINASNGTQDQPDNQAPPPPPAQNETGQAKDELRRNFLPPAYHGPTINSTSGALAVSNRLTTGYPADGIFCTMPATSGTPIPYNASRPYSHRLDLKPPYFVVQLSSRIYPPLIPSYAADYTGYHWAVYDKDHTFYSFDDGDATLGDYDYDDNHDVPAGCQFQAAPLQESMLTGTSGNGHVSAPAPVPSSAVTAEAVPLQLPAPAMHVNGGSSVSYTAPAPAPERAAHRSGTVVTATQAAALSAGNSGAPAQGKLLCKPIEARWEPARRLNTSQIAGIAAAAAVAILILICCVCRPRCDIHTKAMASPRNKLGNLHGAGHQRRAPPTWAQTLRVRM